MSGFQHEKPTRLINKSTQDFDTTIGDLNAQLDRLGDSILPKQPYLLSVPSNVPYRYDPRFIKTWYVGIPFDKSEEQLQYLSFLPHQSDEESLLRVVGGWSDDNGNILQEETSPKTAYNSGRNTPLDQSQRKKISLKDYKTKDKMAGDQDQDFLGVPAPERKKQHTKEDERSPSGRAEPKTENSPKPSQKMPALIAKEDVHRAGVASSTTSASKSQQTDDPSRPVKRRKLTPPDEERKSTPLTSPRIEPEPASRKMPKLLSPTLPSPEREVGLPQLLSPLLPPTLVQAIATPPTSTSSDGNGHQRTESVRSILANAISDNSPRSNDLAGAVTGALGGTRVRSDSQHSVRSNTSGQVKTAVKTLKSNTPLLSASRSPGPRQRHTIILKYGKRNRKRVEALLKFGARPKKLIAKADAQKAPLVQDTQIKSTIDQSAAVERKRNLGASPEPAPKKIKTSASSTDMAKRPTTPVSAQLKERAAAGVLQSSQTRATYTTPRKELKSTAMRRVESTDGADPSTPGDKGRSSTPLNVERTSIPKSSPGPTSTPVGRDEDKQAWSKLNSKFFALGRTIKHEGTSFGPSPSADANDKNSPKSVVLLIEALLCFMINLAARSNERLNTDPGWNTIIPYHIFVFRVSRKVPHLHGLVVQLGAVCRQLINKYDMDRLAKDPLPDEHFGSAPTPGSDGNTKTNEDAEKYKKRYLEFKDSLVQNSRELQTAWLDGSRCLSLDVLERDYPKTWSKRTKDSARRGLDKPTPMKIPKDYYLPMDATTNAFEAVRFSLAFLQEWSDRENVDWRTRIEL